MERAAASAEHDEFAALAAADPKMQKALAETIDLLLQRGQRGVARSLCRTFGVPMKSRT